MLLMISRMPHIFALIGIEAVALGTYAAMSENPSVAAFIAGGFTLINTAITLYFTHRKRK